MGLDCRKCGLCCVSLYEQDAFCDLEPEDMKRLSLRWAKKNVLHLSSFDRLVAIIDGGCVPGAAIRTKWREQKTGPFEGTSACTCIALRGSLMHRTSCSIYANRPRICRMAVKPGDRTCVQIRKMYDQILQGEVVP